MSIIDQSLNETIDSIISTCNLIPEVFRDGIILCNTLKEVIRVSEKVCTFTGYTQEEFITQNPLTWMANCAPIFQKSTVQYVTSIQSKYGHMIPIIIYPKIIQRKNHTLFLLILQKQIELPLPLKNYFLAQFPNRFLFLHEMLRQAILYSHQTNTYGALLLLDIDNFKAVNHVKGYTFGDQILQDIAKKISSVVNTLSVEHLNGDEFAIVFRTHACIYDEAKEEISVLSTKILKAIKEPIIVENQSFRLTASIGIVLFLGEEYGPETIIQYADGTLYEAKKIGRNTVHFFSPLLQQKREEHAKLLERLYDAMRYKQLTIHYQKQWAHHKETGELYVMGAEALIRWIDPIHGYIAPDKFIPLAEESGCIIPLGTWILEETFKQLKAWEQDSIKCHWQLSVNISIKQFERDDFITIVQDFVNTIACNPHKIRFELTESLLIKDLKKSLRKIYALTKLGISLSIDDFGTGYSSLAYLKRLPIHELKIDKTFIRDITTDPADVILVKTMLSIGQYFGLDVVAEGVETKEQYEMLCDMGCYYFQGYFFSKPSEEALL